MASNSSANSTGDRLHADLNQNYVGAPAQRYDYEAFQILRFAFTVAQSWLVPINFFTSWVLDPSREHRRPVSQPDAARRPETSFLALGKLK